MMKREPGTSGGAKTVRTVAFMMGATVLSKLLGMLRGVVLFSRYGTGMEANAFSEASHIPLTFFDLLMSVAILGCFIPVYNSLTVKENGRERADEFACLFLNTVLLATGALALLGIVFAEPLISVLGYALEDGTKALAVKLLRILFPMIIFTGGAYTLVGVMQSKGRFFLPALVSSISNGGVILYLLILDDKLGENRIYGLAAAYLFSWLLQFATLAIPLAAGGFRYRAAFDLRDPDLVRALKMAPPIMLGSWLSPVIIQSGLFFSPFAVDGNVTVFDCANNTYIIIAGILTYSICNYIFPKLSKLSAEGDTGDFTKTVRTGLLSSLVIILPFTFAVELLSGEGIAMIYMRGEFTPEAARQTALTIRTICVGMPAFAVYELLSRMFYSNGMYRVPMLASVCGIAVNIVSSVILFVVLRSGMGAVGAVVALSQYAAAAVLVITAAVRLRGLFSRRFAAGCAIAFGCSCVAGGVMRLAYSLFGNDPYANTAVGNLTVAFTVFAAGAAVYTGLIFVLRKRLLGGVAKKIEE